MTARARPVTASWESLVIEAVGNAIEFWGFKRNQGRVWALLYLRDEPLDAAALRRALGLSKGAVSMITRELEQWGVVGRVRVPGAETWSFVAGTDLMAMVGRVVAVRESGAVGRIRDDLVEAERRAREEGGSPRAIDRVHRLRRLAELTESAIRLFLGTARLDLAEAASVLAAPPAPRLASGRRAARPRSRLA